MRSFRQRRMFGAVLGLCLVVGGCASKPRRGAEPGKGDADITVGDGSLLDAASHDGDVLDGDLPDGDTADGAAVDADLGDGAVSSDAGADSSVGGDGGTPRVPDCDPGTACGAGDSCADGEACVVNACGTKVCQPRAAYCGDSAECAAGSTCVSTSIGDVCTPGNGEVCNASTDCPPSHVCEGAPGSRTCVLRRIPCFDEFDCPVSYMCLGVSGDSASCQYVYRPCNSTGTCPLGTCADIDGLGSSECGSGGACDTNMECSGTDRCMNLHFIVECGLGGLCNASGGDACAPGWECHDLQGDGYGECVPAGGSCTSHATCVGGGICAVPLDRSPARCMYPL